MLETEALNFTLGSSIHLQGVLPAFTAHFTNLRFSSLVYSFSGRLSELTSIDRSVLRHRNNICEFFRRVEFIPNSFFEMQCNISNDSSSNPKPGEIKCSKSGQRIECVKSKWTSLKNLDSSPNRVRVQGMLPGLPQRKDEIKVFAGNEPLPISMSTQQVRKAVRHSGTL